MYHNNCEGRCSFFTFRRIACGESRSGAYPLDRTRNELNEARIPHLQIAEQLSESQGDEHYGNEEPQSSFTD